MKKLFVYLIILLAGSAFAATVPRGSERLSELSVIPTINMSFDLGFVVKDGVVSFTCGEKSSVEISDLRQSLKQKPNDISQWLQLGGLLSDNDKTNEAHQCYLQAERLCRERLESAPQSGLLLVDLSRALDGQNKSDEAENCCRKATQVAPKEWRCWTGLGNLLFARSWTALFPGRSLGSTLSKDDPASLLDFRPSPAVLEKVVALNRESALCFDQAVALAPGETDVYFMRAGHKMFENMENVFIRSYRDGAAVDSKKPTSHLLFTKEAMPDLKKALQLNPQNCEIIGLVAYFEWITASMEGNLEEPSLENLPASSRQVILDASTRLENLTQSPNKKTAADANRYLGMLKMMCFIGEKPDFHAAEPYSRQATILNPTNEASWNLLIMSLVGSDAPTEEFVAVCEARLKAINNAYNHILLAKALARQKNWPKSAHEAEVAAGMDTNNVIAPLLLAAVKLRQSDKPELRVDVAKHLRQVAELIKTMPPGEDRDSRVAEFMLNASVLYALNGQTDEARELVESVLKRFPDDDRAKQILEVLPR